MKLINIISLFLSFFIFSSCSSYQIDKYSKNNQNVSNLSPSQVVFIALPENGKYNDITYSSSGKDTQQALNLIFSRYSDSVILGETSESLKNTKDIAIQEKADILVYPTIYNWEDRNTPWSGITDKVTIDIQIVSLKDNVIIDKTSLSSHSSWFTFTNDPPKKLLPKMFEDYVKQLYGY